MKCPKCKKEMELMTSPIFQLIHPEFLEYKCLKCDKYFMYNRQKKSLREE